MGSAQDKTDLTFRSTAPADFTKLKGQVDSGNVSLDIAYISTTDQYRQAIDEGLIEKLDRRLLQQEMNKYKAGDLKRDSSPGASGPMAFGTPRTGPSSSSTSVSSRPRGRSPIRSTTSGT